MIPEPSSPTILSPDPAICAESPSARAVVPPRPPGCYWTCRGSWRAPQVAIEVPRMDDRPVSGDEIDGSALRDLSRDIAVIGVGYIQGDDAARADQGRPGAARPMSKAVGFTSPARYIPEPTTAITSGQRRVVRAGLVNVCIGRTSGRPPIRKAPGANPEPSRVPWLATTPAVIGVVRSTSGHHCLQQGA
jgi:hypothetical protein